METWDKVKSAMIFVILISLLFALVSSAFSQEWLTFFLVIITLVLILSPYLFERSYNIDLPVEIEVIIVIFIYASLFLGTVHGYYTKYWWWDLVLHTSSGVILGFLGFLLIYSLYRGKKLRANPGLICLLAFSFALAGGALWEIFEFGLGHIPSIGIMQYGLEDTMWDLIVDSLGALFASLIGYIYLKRKETFFLKHLVKNFVNKNPDFFRRKR